MLLMCHNGRVRHSRGVASLRGGGGGAVGVYCGICVVGGKSAFRSGVYGYSDFAGWHPLPT